MRVREEVWGSGGDRPMSGAGIGDSCDLTRASELADASYTNAGFPRNYATANVAAVLGMERPRVGASRSDAACASAIPASF